MGLLLTLSLLACKGDSNDSGVDSASDSGASDSAAEVAVEILSVALSCDQGVQAELLSAGWLSGATLSLYGPETETGWLSEEQHPFPTLPVDYDPSGAWDRYALSLSPAEADYSPGQSTAVDCGLDLSWTVQVQGDAGTDCVAGGAAPDALGCRTLTE